MTRSTLNIGLIVLCIAARGINGKMYEYDVKRQIMSEIQEYIDTKIEMIDENHKSEMEKIKKDFDSEITRIEQKHKSNLARVEENCELNIRKTEQKYISEIAWMKTKHESEMNKMTLRLKSEMGHLKQKMSRGQFKEDVTPINVKEERPEQENVATTEGPTKHIYSFGNNTMFLDPDINEISDQVVNENIIETDDLKTSYEEFRIESIYIY